MTGHIIDTAILILLIGAIGFGLVLERRVKRLMQALADLQPAVDNFAQAVDRSEDSVMALHAAWPRGEAANDDSGEPRAGARGASVPNLRSLRSQAARSARTRQGVAPVSGKADLVKSFFETVGKREA